MKQRSLAAWGEQRQGALGHQGGVGRTCENQPASASSALLLLQAAGTAAQSMAGAVTASFTKTLARAPPVPAARA